MPLNVPPVMAANHVAEGTHEYSRVDGSPTIDAFEEMMGGLECGFAVAFSSGMAACASAFDQLHADSRRGFVIRSPGPHSDYVPALYDHSFLPE
jgi:cystathionine gamma-synthase